MITGGGADRVPSVSAVRPVGPAPPPTPAVHPRRLVLGLLALAVPLGVLGGLTDRAVEGSLRQQVAHEVNGQLNTAIEGMEAWVEDSALVARAAAGDAAVVLAVTTGAGVGAAMGPFVHAGGFEGFAIVPGAAEGPALAASGPLRDLWAAPTRGLRQALAAAIERSGVQPRATGVAILVPPFLAAPERPAMLIGTSLSSSSPGSVGPGDGLKLFLQIPLPRFSRVLQAARVGASGETYAFDRAGRMLSDSRFKGHLRAAGLLGPSEDSAAFRVSVRDPGVDLTTGKRAATLRERQPLTAMAARAVAGEDGHDVAGYRDYRGVMVVGAWRWLPHHGFGLTTEIDAEEAFRTMRPIRRFFLGLLLLLGAMATGLTVLARINTAARARVQRAERQVAELGQYRLLRKLGQGGMGAVYLATHAFLRRPTAIKVLRPDRSGPEFVARFEREVQSTSELAHVNTVAIYDFGQTPEGLLYYAMEYLEGANLEQLVQRYGPLPPARVIYLIRQACGSLCEAHGRGLIHRDVKPANLFTCRRGGQSDVVKVLDFGLAKWYRQAAQVTEVATVVGTPEYMAPELFESADAASPQSDIYAVGAVAYYLLTGKRLFEESSLAALSTAHLSREPVPPSERLGRPIDATLEAVVMSCLAKRPEGRPAGAASLSWLLESSPEAHRWGPHEADAWWTEHEAELLRAEAEGAPPGASVLSPNPHQTPTIARAP
jgi:eukaryotic-like serine/threonine-protein kinase